jgi:hypothetical protein
LLLLLLLLQPRRERREEEVDAPCPGGEASWGYPETLRGQTYEGVVKGSEVGCRVLEATATTTTTTTTTCRLDCDGGRHCTVVFGVGRNKGGLR